MEPNIFVIRNNTQKDYSMTHDYIKHLSGSLKYDNEWANPDINKKKAT